MDTQNFLGSLNLMTLGIVLVVLLALAWAFFRKRENRHPMGENEGLHSNLDAAAQANSDPPRAKDVRN